MKKFHQAFGEEKLAGEYLEYFQKVNPEFLNQLKKENIWKAFQEDIFTEWKGLRQIDIGGVKYLKKYEDVKFVDDDGFGAGADKTAYEVVGDNGVIILKYHDDFLGNKVTDIASQLKVLDQLKSLGFPVVEIQGVSFHKGAPAIISKKLAADFVPFTGISDKLEAIANPNTVRHMIQDIKSIKERVIQNKMYINDIQFLISSNGRVVLHDIPNIQLNALSTDHENTVRALDDFIKELSNL